MDPRIGQRIIRDRWGEPVKPPSVSPECLKSERWPPPAPYWSFVSIRVTAACQRILRIIRQGINANL